MLEPIEKFLFEVLSFFYSYVHDYGFAIVLLTVAIRVVLLPLTMKQTKSTYELQRIQPKIKELQEKYKNNKEKLQEETLKFYQENKVNPLGGCLPLILQMPIFFALFRVLGSVSKKIDGKKTLVPGLLLAHIAALPAAEAVVAKRFWIILPDLTSTPQKMFESGGIVAALPYAILVVMFGLSILVPQLMQPGTDKSQRNIAVYMSLMMLWFGWVSPAGVLVYWVTSSVLQIGQQWLLQKAYARKEGAE
ncbi:MAG: YidC/Oxa1 family membrane protein insertase [Actinobacteria bacterium]|nr:MAG: YidC/Oxa1 family membrane protein insertase [Actinomycetota bacterium]